MLDWRSQFDFSQVYWDDFKALLLQLDGPQFPSAKQLCRLLPHKLRSHGGNTIRFVATSELSAAGYEQRIYSSGEVSTREENWHDLFNALVWSRFPRLKAAMNAVHMREQKSQEGSMRGMQRDALTLLDESGAIVVSTDESLLKSLAWHDWTEIFQTDVFRPLSADGCGRLNVFICGHALLEKFLQPYKAITAQVLLIHLSEELISRARGSLRYSLDQVLADELIKGRLLESPANLSPLPLMGIPEWWPGAQDSNFYADQGVFRPLRRGLEPAPIFHL